MKCGTTGNEMPLMNFCIMMRLFMACKQIIQNQVLKLSGLSIKVSGKDFLQFMLNWNLYSAMMGLKLLIVMLQLKMQRGKMLYHRHYYCKIQRWATCRRMEWF